MFHILSIMFQACSCFSRSLCSQTGSLSLFHSLYVMFYALKLSSFRTDRANKPAGVHQKFILCLTEHCYDLETSSNQLVSDKCRFQQVISCHIDIKYQINFMQLRLAFSIDFTSFFTSSFFPSSLNFSFISLVKYLHIMLFSFHFCI